MNFVYWSKTELAQGAGVGPQYIYKIRKGERTMSIEKKRNLLNFYQSKYNELGFEVTKLQREINESMDLK